MTIRPGGFFRLLEVAAESGSTCDQSSDSGGGDASDDVWEDQDQIGEECFFCNTELPLGGHLMSAMLLGSFPQGME